jgi:DMSO/TMAO reductase YedYZ molybdopterin-dependent catalytic subunit
MTTASLSRRGFLALSTTAGVLAAVRPSLAVAAVGPILKPLPGEWFVPFGTNAEMRWDSVDPRRYRTTQERLFVRNHTSTPTIDARSYRLRVFGDGLVTARAEGAAVSLSLADLSELPPASLTSVHECTGNGRRFFAAQQGKPAPGTQWSLGAVGTVRWDGVWLRDVLASIGLAPDAVSIQATGLDDPYVTGGVDYGRVRRPFPVAKALDDALLAWGVDGDPLLPDHGFPLRLVLPGWVGIASIKWLGSLEVSTLELTSPWNTKWYRMSGGDYPVDSPPLAVLPVRSAWELPEVAHLPRDGGKLLHGRSWSGAGRIERVEVSTDGGVEWQRAELVEPGEAWTRWRFRWPGGAGGDHVLMARATDAHGRVQPLTTPYNSSGYLFDAVVRHRAVVD